MINKLIANVKRNIAYRRYHAMKWGVKILEAKLIGNGFYRDRIRFLAYRRTLRQLHMRARYILISREVDRINRKVIICQKAGRYFLFKRRYYAKKVRKAAMIQSLYRGYYERRYRS